MSVSQYLLHIPDFAGCYGNVHNILSSVLTSFILFIFEDCSTMYCIRTTSKNKQAAQHAVN